MDDAVRGVRQFSRFYTRRIGVLQEGLLGSALTLTEGRVLYELAAAGSHSAAALAGALGLDTGYLSRILRRFEAEGWIERRASEADARRQVLLLTAAGRAAFETIDARSDASVATMLGPLPAGQRVRLVEALRTVERLLGGGEAGPPRLRAPMAGDFGWVVHRQGVLYAAEYGWDQTFEGLVASIVGRFVEGFDPRWERCWIAEWGGAVAGSVFLVRETEAVGKLRLLYVEPEARGLGIGRDLVAACIEAARGMGYRRLVLWTNDVLVAARRIYERAGFRKVAEERHRSFGCELVGESWALEL